MGKLSEWPDWKRRKDPELWDFYEENILEPGWVGQLAETEYNYILFKLNKYKRLQNRWGFKGLENLIGHDAIQAVAMWGDPEDKEHNATLIRNTLKANHPHSKHIGTAEKPKEIKPPHHSSEKYLESQTQLQLSLWS